jgi:hypothetical protein
VIKARIKNVDFSLLLYKRKSASLPSGINYAFMIIDIVCYGGINNLNVQTFVLWYVQKI